jgi:hypothetical protein
VVGGEMREYNPVSLKECNERIRHRPDPRHCLAVQCTSPPRISADHRPTPPSRESVH